MFHVINFGTNQKNSILPYIIGHNISPIQKKKKKKKKRKKKNTGIVGNIQTDPWSEIYTSAAYINQGFKLSWNVLFNHYPFISKRRFGSYIPTVVFRYEKFTKS